MSITGDVLILNRLLLCSLQFFIEHYRRRGRRGGVGDGGGGHDLYHGDLAPLVLLLFLLVFLALLPALPALVNLFVDLKSDSDLLQIC